MKLALWLIAGIATAADLQVLRTSKDSNQLLEAAIQVVKSGDSADLSQLTGLLGSREFLGRLDALTSQATKFVRLQRLFAAIEAAPSPATEDLCLKLAADPNFTAEPVRLNYLLPALAAVKPMSEASAAVFRRTNAQGYFSVNAPVLTANGSALAIRLFEAMMLDRTIDAEVRVDAARVSIVPHRTELTVLRSIDRLLERKPELPLQIALLESVFDYRPGEWFGVSRTPPVPPGWETASPDARRFAAALGKRHANRTDLPATLRLTIQRGLQTRPSNLGKQILH